LIHRTFHAPAYPGVDSGLQTPACPFPTRHWRSPAVGSQEAAGRERVPLLHSAGSPAASEVRGGQGVLCSSQGGYATEQDVTVVEAHGGKGKPCEVIARDFWDRESEPFRVRLDEGCAEERIPTPSRAASASVKAYRALGGNSRDDRSDGILNWEVGSLPKPMKAAAFRRSGYHEDMARVPGAEIKGCSRCHPGSKLYTVFYPVVVRLSKAVTRSGDRPLMDDIMTCVSCNHPQQGNEPYLLRKRGRRLCPSCHADH